MIEASVATVLEVAESVRVAAEAVGADGEKDVDETAVIGC